MNFSKELRSALNLLAVSLVLFVSGEFYTSVPLATLTPPKSVSYEVTSSITFEDTQEPEDVKVAGVSVVNDLEQDLYKTSQNSRVDTMRSLSSRGALDRDFYEFDLRTPSGLTSYDIDSILESTQLKGLGKAFVQAELKYGVNALALVSIAAHESAWGSSRLAVERNNIFGYKAYDHDINQAGWFETKEDCIMVVARLLSVHYLTEGAVHHNGYSLRAVNVRYATDKNWSRNIANTMERLAAQVNW